MGKWFRITAMVMAVVLAVMLTMPPRIAVNSGGMIGLSFSGLGAEEPEPPEPMELIGHRERNSKTHYLGGDSYSLDVGIGSAHYRDEFGDWKEIDNSWQAAVAPWDWKMAQDGYHTYALEDFTYGQILLFESQGETVAFQPMALEWTNDLDQIEQISMPQDVAASVSNEPIELLPGMSGSIGKIRWSNGYGIGRHFEWENQPGRLSKLLILDSSPPGPPQFIIDGGSPVLRLNLIFDPSKDLDIYVDGALWNRVTTEQSFSTIEFKKDGEVVWGFIPAAYWDSEEGGGVAATELRKKGGKLYVSVRVPYEWLQTATYPVYVDPDLDLQVGANLDDAHERSDGLMYDSSTTVIHDADSSGSGRYWGGHRWVSGSLPSEDDTIDVAYVEVYVAFSTDDTPNLNWHFEKATLPVQFTTTAYNITDRTRTSASASWIVGLPGTGIGWVQSPSLVTPLQELIDDYSPTALVLISRPNTDTGRDFRTRSHNYDTSLAAKLHIEWTGGASESEITVSPTSYDFGVVSENSTYNTTTSYFTVNNTSSVQTDQTISVTTSTWSGGVTWIHSDTAEAGVNTVGLLARRGGEWGIAVIVGLKIVGISGGEQQSTVGFANYSSRSVGFEISDLIVKFGSPNYIYENCPAGTGYSFGLKLITPTEFTDGIQKQAVVRVTAVAG